jgi:hypothetical protein
MIAEDTFSEALTLLAVRLRWRSDRALADHLRGFSATEAGSALDMLKAAELENEPKLRAQFFKHALDEARHAEMFRRAANELDGPSAGRDDTLVIRATRQNLFARYGLVRFLAFVFLSERRAARTFEVLRRRYQDRPEIEALFRNVLKDERFHVAYSEAALAALAKNGRAAEVRMALWSIRLESAWAAYKRVGRVASDALARLLSAVLYFMVLPVFVLFERARPAETGWQAPRALAETLDDARREG